MNEKIDLKKLEQKSWRELNQDGMTEIMMGLMLLMFSIGPIRPTSTIFGAVFFIFGASALERIRKRMTYPRIGYVKLVEEDPKSTARGMGLYFVIVLAAMTLVIAILAGGLDLDMLRTWSPALAGFLISGGMIYAASKSGAIRYYVFLALAVGLGIAASILNPKGYAGLTPFFLIFGMIVLLWGSAMLLRFIRKYPMPAGGGNDVTS